MTVEHILPPGSLEFFYRGLKSSRDREMDAQKKEKNHVEGFQRLRENSEAYPLDTSPQ